jgi:CheY-like chemotaxis protein
MPDSAHNDESYPETWVLIIDPHPQDRAQLEAVVTAGGCSVIAVESSADGLDFVDTVEFDLVLVSSGVPRLSGAGVAREIREYGRRRISRVPILAIVAVDTSETRAPLVEAGFDGFLVRPVDASAFRAELRRHIGAPLPDFVPDRALDFVRGDEGKLRTELTDFVERAPARLELMRGALGAHDAPALDETAHSLEHEAHRLALLRIRDLSHQLAALSRRGDLEEAGRILRELDDAVAQGQSAVRRQIGAA